MRKALFFVCSLLCAPCLAGAALADTTITITNSACKDPVAPAEVAPPVTPIQLVNAHKWTPGQMDGKPVDSAFQIAVEWKLPGTEPKPAPPAPK